MLHENVHQKHQIFWVIERRLDLTELKVNLRRKGKPVIWSVRPEARSHVGRGLPRPLVGPPSLWGPSAPES